MRDPSSASTSVGSIGEPTPRCHHGSASAAEATRMPIDA
jgi:hypothetical protein